MTPQERDLITHLLARLKQAAGPKDAEAEALIRQAMAEQPDAPYYLVQTVLIQDMALSNAQHRITDLEQQVAQPPPASQPGSFLGGLFGRAAPTSGGGVGSVPAAGPWSRPPMAPQPMAGQPMMGQPMAGQPMMGQPMMGQPMMGQAMPMMASSGGGFLRQAATTAAGIAGGALLFEGIQSMFGQHAGGILSNASMQPGLSETVINNYYGNDPAAGGSQAAWDPAAPGGDPAAGYAAASGGDPGVDPGVDPGADYAADQGLPADQDLASNRDLGSSGDFGSNDDQA